MFLRITRGRFDPARYDEVTLVVREVNAAVEQLPGFQHLHSGLDRAGGRLAVATLWETREQAQFSRDALGEVMRRTEAAGLQLEPAEVYEVTS